MLKKFFIRKKKKNSKANNEIHKVYIDIPYYEEYNRATREDFNLKLCCLGILKSSNIRIPTDIREREKRCLYVNSTKDVAIYITRYKGNLFFILRQEDTSGYRIHLYSSTIAEEDLQA